MGQKLWIYEQKKVSEIWTYVFRFRTLFYLNTWNNLLPSSYSIRLNVEMSNQNQKNLLQAIWKPMVYVRTFRFLTLSKIRTHWNLNVLFVSQKFWMSKIRTCWNLNWLAFRFRHQTKNGSVFGTFRFQTFGPFGLFCLKR